MVLRLPDRSILVVLVYVRGSDTETLLDTTEKLRQLIEETRHRIGIRVDVILTGDFNRHDQLWAGDDISLERQGEANTIIDLMSDYGLYSPLPRGRRRGNAATMRPLSTWFWSRRS